MSLLSNARVPVREDIFHGSLAHLDELRLRGSSCCDCGEIALGNVVTCMNCGSDAAMQEVVLASEGQLHTFTVVRSRPPGDYRGPEPFRPFVMGLVELPDGLRVLSVIDCPIEMVRIGMDLTFAAYDMGGDDKGEIMVGFAFRMKGLPH